MNKYFGEWVHYEVGSEFDRPEATKWLEQWKKNLIYKLNRDSFHVNLVDEQWIDRDPLNNGILASHHYLGLKICLESDFNFELK